MHVHDFLNRVRKATIEMTDRSGKLPTDEELAKHLEVTVVRIQVRGACCSPRFSGCVYIHVYIRQYWISASAAVEVAVAVWVRGHVRHRSTRM